MPIYMDHNATSPLSSQAAQAIRDALADNLGNPSSVHGYGRLARDRVEEARRYVAALLGAAITDVVFTSGGTEADWLGVASLAAATDGAIWTTGTAHPALIGAADHHGRGTERLAVDSSGRVELSSVETACRDGAAVVALSLANHEVGTVQDVAAVAALAHDCGALVHCDAVQAAGRIPLDVAALGADSVAISGHKLGAPMGIGALWLRPGIAWVAPWPGGQQERGRRPGTENVLGAIGFGAAAHHALAVGVHDAERIQTLTSTLEAGVRCLDGVRVHGAGGPRIGNTLSVGFDGALGEVVVQALDIAGVAVSTGAACSSGTNAASATLLAIGVAEDVAQEAVRFSLGPGNTAQEVQVVLDALPRIIGPARSFR